MVSNKKNTTLKNKAKKETEGITLIALVVTIIVLLILAGISISMLAGNNGILKRAGEAKEKTTMESEEEQIKIAYGAAVSDGLGNLNYTNLVSELTKQLGTKGIAYSITPETEETDEWKVEYNGGSYIISKTGVVKPAKLIALGAKVGDYVTYDASSGDGEGLTVTPSDVYEIVQKSDNSTAEKNFEGGAVLTDTDIFKSNDITKWRIISTKGGIVKLMGETSTAARVCFTGTEGFKHAEEVLNTICSIYGKGKGAINAKSIELEDLNLNNSKLLMENTGKQEYSKGKFFKQILKNGKVEGYENILTEATTENPITMYDNNNYGIKLASFSNSDILLPLFQTASSNNYFWINTRYTHVTSYGSVFGMLYVDNDNYLCPKQCFASTGATAVGYYSVLPVVTLESEIIGTATTTENVTTWTLNL